MVFLQVSPLKGVMRFENKGKLSPRYIRPYKIIERVGNVAYRLDLPMKLEGVQPVFHMSMLRQYLSDPPHIICPQEVKLDEALSYEEVPLIF